jgi:hypothetical protein
MFSVWSTNGSDVESWEYGPVHHSRTLPYVLPKKSFGFGHNPVTPVFRHRQMARGVAIISMKPSCANYNTLTHPNLKLEPSTGAGVNNTLVFAGMWLIVNRFQTDP